MRTFAFTILLMSSLLSKAQDVVVGPDTEDCKKYLSLYYVYLTNNQLEDAKQFYFLAHYHCGGTKNMHPGFFTNGRILFNKLIAASQDSIRTEGYSDTLSWVYEQKMQIEHDPKWEMDYGIALMRRNQPNVSKIDSLFHDIDSLQDQTEPMYIKSYFNHLIMNHYNRAKAEHRPVVREKIGAIYFRLYKYGSVGKQKAVDAGDEQKAASYQEVLDYLDRYYLLMYPISQDFEKVMEVQYQLLPADKKERLTQINRAIFLLERKNAQKSDIYRKYVHESVQLAPTPDGFYGIGNYELEQKNYKSAIKAFEKALELDVDQKNSDLYYLKTAQAKYEDRQYDRAYYSAKKVKGDSSCEALLICAKCVVAKANDCGTSTFERKANYWLANDYYRRAAAMGCNVNPNMYMDKAPTNGECFDEGKKEGDIIELKCWGETTKVRF